MLTRLTPRGTSSASFVKKTRSLQLSSHKSLRGREISVSSDDDDDDDDDVEEDDDNDEKKKVKESNSSSAATKKNTDSTPGMPNGSRRSALNRKSIMPRLNTSEKTFFW